MTESVASKIARLVNEKDKIDSDRKRAEREANELEQSKRRGNILDLMALLQPEVEEFNAAVPEHLRLSLKDSATTIFLSKPRSGSVTLEVTDGTLKMNSHKGPSNRWSWKILRSTDGILSFANTTSWEIPELSAIKFVELVLSVAAETSPS